MKTEKTEKEEGKEGEVKKEVKTEDGDEKMWADVDKDLGEILASEVNNEGGNKSSDEDEDSRPDGERYDRSVPHTTNLTFALISFTNIFLNYTCVINDVIFKNLRREISVQLHFPTCTFENNTLHIWKKNCMQNF